MSGKFSSSFSEAAREEGVTLDIGKLADLYTDWQLVKLTGWSLEYIQGLGMLTAEAFLQFHDAEQALMRESVKKR